MSKKPERLEMLFAIEFGQLLENHVFGSTNKEELTEIIRSSLGLRSKQQLAQVYAGYDIPSTANIFELIRTLNDPDFTHRFLNLNTALPNLLKDKEAVAAEPTQTEKTKKVKEEVPYWLVAEEEGQRLRQDAATQEWGDIPDIDMNLINF